MQGPESAQNCFTNLTGFKAAGSDAYTGSVVAQQFNIRSLLRCSKCCCDCCCLCWSQVQQHRCLRQCIRGTKARPASVSSFICGWPTGRDRTGKCKPWLSEVCSWQSACACHVMYQYAPGDQQTQTFCKASGASAGSWHRSTIFARIVCCPSRLIRELSSRRKQGLATAKHLTACMCRCLPYQHAQWKALVCQAWQISNCNFPCWPLQVPIIWTEVPTAQPDSY